MWRAVARSPLRGKVLTRFRYHRHYFKYIVRYPYGDDATQFRTLREHHVRSKWVPKLALIIILFILSIDKNQVSLLQNHPGEPHGHKTGYAARIYPGIRSLALSCLGGLSTESGRSQGESEAFHTRGGKPSHKLHYGVRNRVSSHQTTSQHLAW